MRHSDIQVLVVVFVTVVLGLLDTLCKCEEGSSIVKQALGRVAQLGSLYDARRDSFCEYSLFKRSLADSLVQRTHIGNTLLTYELENTYESKFRLMSLDGQLRMSVLGGLLSLQGSAKYLRDEKKSYRAVRANLVYKMLTVHESVDIAHLGKDVINRDALRHAARTHHATHMVVGIRWGANVIGSFEHANQADADTGDIKLSMSAMIKRLVADTAPNGSGNDPTLSYSKAKNDTLMDEHISVQFYGDVLLDDAIGVPQSLGDVQQAMRRVPELVRRQNDGKGVQLEYVLLALDSVERIVLQSSSSSSAALTGIVGRLDDELAMRVQHEFDALLVERQQIADLRSLVTEHSALLNRSTIADFQRALVAIDVRESALRREFKSELLAVRAGKLCAQQMLTAGKLEELNHHIANEFLAEHKWLRVKLRWLHMLRTGYNIRSLPKSDTLDHLLHIDGCNMDDFHDHDESGHQQHQHDALVLFYSDELRRSDQHAYMAKYNYLLSKARAARRSLVANDTSLPKIPLFLLVDYDIHPEQRANGVQLVKYSRDGQTSIVEMDEIRALASSGSGRFGGATTTTSPLPTTQPAAKTTQQLQGTTQTRALLLTGSMDRSVKIVDAQTGDIERTIKIPSTGSSGHGSFIYALVTLGEAAGGWWFASGGNDGLLRVYNGQTGDCALTLDGHTDYVRALELISSDEDDHLLTLASGSGDRSIKIWSLSGKPVSRGHCLRTLVGHDKGVWALKSLRRGDRLVSGSQDSTVRVWQVATGASLLTLQGHSGAVNCLELLNTRLDTIASGSADHTVRVWNANSGECVRKLVGHVNSVVALALVDEERLVSASADSTIRVWRWMTNGACMITLSEHPGAITAMTLLGGGMLATGSSVASVKIWSLQTHGDSLKCLNTRQPHTSYISSLAMLHVPDAKAQMTGPLERKLSLQTFSYTRPNVPAKLIRKGSLTNPPLPFIPKYVYSYRG